MKGKKQNRGSLGMASSSTASGAASPRGGEEERGEEHSLTGLVSDDTLLHIMRCLSTRELLSSLAFVCHRWRRLCQSYSVYELVPSPLTRSRKPWGNMGRKQLLQLAASHASTVERVHLHGLKQFKSKEIVALCQSLPKLQDLAIVSCSNFETTDLELTVSQLPTQLISFDIHRDRWVAFPVSNPLSFQINDKILESVHQRCPRLQKLDLDCIAGITQKGLEGLLQACTSLTSLNLDCPLLGWPDVAQVFKSCKSLCHFSLVSPHLIQTTGSSDDEESMDGFTEIYRRGRAASKHWKGNVSLSAEVSLGEDMPKHLTSIRLYASSYRSAPLELPPMLGLLRSRGHQLRQLHAQGVFNTSWQTISVLCANLKLLDLTHNGRIILTEVEEVVLCGLIQLLKKLEHIALPSATDQILTELGRFCPNLREIRFRGTNLPYDAVTDSGVRAIAEGCPVLKVLSLPSCNKLTISSARALAFHCRQLEILILNKCIKFSDDAVAALLPRLSSSLVFLDLFDCRITQSSLEAIRQYAKVTSLRVVAITRSLWLRSQSVIEDIHSCNPRLTIRIDSGIVWDGFYHGRAFE